MLFSPSEVRKNKEIDPYFFSDEKIETATMVDCFDFLKTKTQNSWVSLTIKVTEDMEFNNSPTTHKRIKCSYCGVYTENNICSQCGAPIEIEKDDKVSRNPYLNFVSGVSRQDVK